MKFEVTITADVDVKDEREAAVRKKELEGFLTGTLVRVTLTSWGIKLENTKVGMKRKSG